ncbi:MAG: vanadium-dependent haloperoxidase [Pseudomonas sp.]|nr:vanadium-dependent haloperoxidase [Pseudomonas sp.]|tara:strand:- start:22253 stop:23518 length:1266 start_codon:yes stop_codon:yes gene_type:complete
MRNQSAFFRLWLICLLMFYLAPVGAGLLRTEPDTWVPWLDINDAKLEFVQSSSHSQPDSPLELSAWTRMALELIQKYERNGVRASRLLGYLHVAMHDAIAIGKSAGLSDDSAAIAAHLAAKGTLVYFFPTEPVERFDSYLIELLARSYPNDWPVLMDDTSPQRAIADNTVQALVERARSDGAERVWALGSRPKAFPGMYEAHPPLFAYNPLEALAGEWRPWLETGSPGLGISPPPEFGSERFTEELNEVIGVSKTLTARQRKIAEDWHLDAGSVTPAGIWNYKALEWANEYGLSQFATVRLLTTLNVAMSDATIHGWAVKYRWWTMRPITAAHKRGDTDFIPALATPPHPSYVSGHSAVSGAAAAVLSAYMPEAKPRAVATANEASISRLYGGIHFRSDNEEGLRLGELVGKGILNKNASR